MRTALHALDHARATLPRCLRVAAAVVALSLGVATGIVVPPAAAHAAEASSPLGLWKTVDDKTGQARAIVRLYEQDGKLFGRIEQSFTPGAATRVCAVCTDARKNQPIIGLLIIRNMTPDGAEFANGDILDPESGSVYRCKMHLEQSGERLIVRGYIGFALLGRSQTWQRQN
jgi:uncharacterized protein (DUF2147 family)